MGWNKIWNQRGGVPSMKLLEVHQRQPQGVGVGLTVKDPSLSVPTPTFLLHHYMYKYTECMAVHVSMRKSNAQQQTAP